MNGERGWHPDLLRRFVATPYVFRGGAESLACIESNDLEIALSLWNARFICRGQNNRELSCKVIREAAGSADGAEMVVISDGPLRVLYQGRTILIHDCESAEVLGFVSSDVKAPELVSLLLPALFAPQSKEFVTTGAFTKK
ncbi:MAG TPA: hypothetical protein VNU92_04220 [Edaphobacter sp.]|jgi:hypothetical protein|nr:hypothetical protein [Edaphobacter sp.]